MKKMMVEFLKNTFWVAFGCFLAFLLFPNFFK